MITVPEQQFWYVTFGQQYSRNPHPRWPKAHPDGVLAVKAFDYDQARQFVLRELGTCWSDLVSQHDWLTESWKYYPRGVIEIWDAAREPVSGRTTT